MKKIGLKLAALLIFLLAAQPPVYSQCRSQSGIAMDVAQFPAQPSPQDTVTVEVSGYFPDGCWGCPRNENFDSECTGTEILDSARRVGSTIYLYASARDGWMPEGACVLVIVPYRFRINVGTLPAGNYTIVSLMETNSLREPSGVTCSTGFSVAGSSPCIFNRGGYEQRHRIFSGRRRLAHELCLYG